MFANDRWFAFENWRKRRIGDAQFMRNIMRKNKPIVLGAAGLLFLTACATDPSQYPGTEGNRTQEGAIAGAAIGGVLGAITGEGSRGDDIVRGAIIGGVAGGVAGNIMDRQAAELRNEFGNGDIEVINTGSELIVRMPNAILFASDSAALNPQLPITTEVHPWASLNAMSG